MKDKIFGVLQRVGRSFMLPIAILPIAGLLLGIGNSFTNETMLTSYGLMDVMGPGTVMYAVFTVFSAAGNVIFANLPILFAVGVAIGMAKKEKAVAALAAMVSFLMMHSTIGAMITINGGIDAMLTGSTTPVLGIVSLQMGVFGGIIVGLGVAALHNKFYKIELPQVLSFFGGTRFVPIISSVVYVGVGILMFFVWPIVQTGMNNLGSLVMNSGYIGTFLYGVIERALIPFGLHHVFYIPFWQTAVGGTMLVDGHMVEGAQNIFFAQLGSQSVSHFSVDATRFMSGKFPLMIFGLPGAALAMYRCARPEKRKVVGGLLLSASLTAMLTGITEPIEFTFLFVAPALYGIHCVFAGLAYMLMHMLNVGVGMTFSGGIIDLVLFGVMQGNEKTSWIWIIVVGIGYFIVYYFLFSFIIKKFNLKTPGREADDEETKLYTRADVNAKNGQGGSAAGGNSKLSETDALSALIVKGLGGKKNISDVDCCATRLRTTVIDGSKVSKELLTASGAAGVIQKGNGVQVIYGPRVTVIKSNIDDFLDNPISDDDNILDTTEANSDSATKPEENKQKPADAGSDKLVFAPLTGKISTLADIKDGVFSSGMLGEGIAIEPEVGKVLSPVNGKITAVTETKHAVGITSDDGLELFVHVGIDTVELKGQYFDMKVKVGDVVKVGDLLSEFDIDGIKSKGYKTITPVLVGNSSTFKEVKILANGSVKAGEKLIDVK